MNSSLDRRPKNTDPIVNDGPKRRKKRRILETESDSSLKSIVYNNKRILKRGVKAFSITNLITEYSNAQTSQIVNFFMPVSVCVVFVLLTISCLPYFAASINYSELIPGVSIPIESESSSTRDKTLSAIICASIVVCLAFLMTTCVAALMVRGWFGGLNAIFTLSLILILSFSYVYLFVIFNTYNIAFDVITVCFIVWNYTAVGIIILRSKTRPKFLERTYNVLISVTGVLFFIKLLPSWTTWILLFLIALLDIYEVFIGPLKTIVEIEGNGNVYLPVYSAIVRVIEDKTSGESTNTIEREECYEMGLGDFVFYTLLIGKSYATCSLLSAIICYVGVLFGMIITDLMLLYLEKAVPALPVSIYLGLIFHFIAVWFIIPFNDRLITKQIFI